MRRWLRDECGAVVLEFALMTPILVLLICAIIDFSRAEYTLNQLIGAVREGARFAAVHSAPAGATGAIKGVVQNYYAPIDTSKVAVLDSTAINGRITVRVDNHPFVLITPLVKFINKDTLFMTRAATFRWERSPTP
ncbi:MAG TPA: TadE/TadG family type IV pilus assembly protein [Gemmatimonadaceae bacterium]|jgi:Flp pilus assembly protein TadG|nr:TadE/TadG family type IV pilus assembly protein [Gemmatimonadaceae bacterium]